MTYTTHGHQIPGTILDPTEKRPLPVRCGGPSFCKKCALEAISTLHADLAIEVGFLNPTTTESNEKTVNTVEITPIDMVRKPFYVKAVQVTEQNMDTVAKWCGGEVKMTERSRTKRLVKCVHVEVLRATAEWQKQARVGDWVVATTAGYKVYTDKALKDAFDVVDGSDNYGSVLTYKETVSADCD